MEKISKLLYFYRVKDWIKNLGFSILGLYISTFNPILLILNLIQTSFLFSFLFSINDFFDHVIHKEKNFIGNLLKQSILSKKLILLFCFLPLFLSIIVLILNFSIQYFIFYSIFVILSIAYSFPKIRLRDKPIIDIICNISFFLLIFLQSYFFVKTIPIIKMYFFLFWIIFYIFSQEITHQLSHFKKDEKTGRISTVILIGKNKSIYILKFSFILPIIFGIVTFYLFPILKVFAIIMIFSNLIRFFYLKFDEKLKFEKLRNRLGGILEGGFYFLLCSLGF
jgi:4-hydroxybenzoate polyprenyltransferase